VADLAESVIFVSLGVELVHSVSMGISGTFIMATIAITLLARAISVYGLLGCVNSYRRDPWRFSSGDKFILFYGGLRGAIAFALASVLLEDKALCVDEAAFVPFRHRDLFVSTTIVLIVFTILVQGTTINPVPLSASGYSCTARPTLFSWPARPPF
jgi:NhaP-type Na+/H+ or K+/H+ antiporter